MSWSTGNPWWHIHIWERWQRSQCEHHQFVQWWHIHIWEIQQRSWCEHHQFVQCSQKRGTCFNSAKCSIKHDSVTFFGGVFSAEGYSPDPAKIQGITEMTSPQMKQELQAFLGAVNYLQIFVPHLSHHTEPLWAILKKENSFTWDENSNTSFQKIKSLLEKALLKPLRYYDRNKPVTLQCDASLKGLGACIIQEGQPIAFASKSLTETETCYANIERELIAIVFGCEKFHTYLYRRTFIVETWSQTSRNDQHEESHHSSSQVAENVTQECSSMTWS